MLVAMVLWSPTVIVVVIRRLGHEHGLSLSVIASARCESLVPTGERQPSPRVGLPRGCS